MFILYDEKFNKVPIKVWLEHKSKLDQNCLEQATHLSNHPAIFHHVALMPDAHMGMGMPIGGVIATDNAIIPNAVGVDIGCGMIASKLSYKGTPKKDAIVEIIKQIKNGYIPVGMGNLNKSQCDISELPTLPMGEITEANIGTARLSLGTLGAGNHFIEIQMDEEDNLWVMVHCGSRNLGLKVCNHYNNIAKDKVDAGELSWLDADSIDGQNYITEMNWALDFAYKNRNKIIKKTVNLIKDVFGKYKMEIPSVLKTVNIHHNYASLENHFGENVWVHRKGATSAKDGEIGIIPGSMGTNSYIVMGKGFPESFTSCSHGAGRKMSRTAFNSSTNLKQVEKQMKGIVHSGFEVSSRNKRKGRTGEKFLDLSEAPKAYKDIDKVINNELDLITPIVKLTPIGVAKG